jgi:hypothetical protein
MLSVYAIDPYRPVVHTHIFGASPNRNLTPENPGFTANPDKIVAQEKNPQFCIK